ncbi:MAG: FitA-like ribbon-helix-helix domain-containing protein [Pseudonocardiaceae bacterium]
MATIQIRELPEETYETIRRRARANGMSIQAYMRDRVIELASRPTAAEVWDSVEETRDSEQTPGLTREQILSDLRDIRGE